MLPRRPIRSLVVFAACVTAPLVAFADGSATSGRSVARSHGGGPAPAHIVQVDERFAREMAGGCQFVESVTGSLSSRADAHAQGGVVYEPDLRIEARTSCEGGATRVVPARTVRARGLDAGALAALLGTRGTTRVPTHGNEVCSFVPVFVVVDGTVRSQPLAQSCGVRDGQSASGDRAR